METFILIIHLLSIISIVVAIFIELTILNSKEQNLKILRKKVQNLVAHPAIILGFFSGIYLITQLDGSFAGNSWVNLKFLFFLVLVIVQIMISLKGKKIDKGEIKSVSKKFLISMITLVVIAVIGAVTTVVVFQESEDDKNEGLIMILG